LKPARRIFDDAWLLICQKDLSPAVGLAPPPVMTLESQHIESVARRVGELLESIAGKVLTAFHWLVAAGEMPLREPECRER
jgi:hypothetical protein